MNRRLFLSALLLACALSFPAAAIAQWTLTNGPFGGIYAVTPAGGDTLYAGTRNGVYRSLDGARSWHPIGLQGGPVTLLWRFEGRLFAAGNGMSDDLPGWDLQRSTDEGGTWSRVMISRPDGDRLIPGGMGAQQGVIYASGGNLAGAAHAFSTDGGDTWSTMEFPNPADESTAFHFTSNGDTTYAYTGYYVLRRVSVASQWEVRKMLPGFASSRGFACLGRTLLIANDGILISRNGGASWGPVLEDATRLAVGADGRVFALVHSTVMVSSDTGITWAPLLSVNRPVGGLQVGGGRLLFGMETGGSLFAYDEMEERVVRADSGMIASSVVRLEHSGADLFAVTDLLHHTRDNGDLWREPGLITAVRDLPRVLVQVDSLLIGGGDRLYRTADLGRTWPYLVDTLTVRRVVDVFNVDGAVYALMESTQPLIVSRDTGLTWQPVLSRTMDPYGAFIRPPLVILAARDYLLRSLDSGRTWDSLPMPLQGNGVADVRFVATGSGGLLMYAPHTPYGLWRSLDSGATWGELMFDNGPANAIAARGDTVAVGTDDGVFISFDGLTTWSRWGESFHERVNAIVLAGDRSFVGTHGRGVWRTGAPISAVPAEPGVIAGLRVEPNPVRSHAALAFTQARGGEVVVEIADLLGRSIRRTSLGLLDAGEHRAAMDCTGLPAGWYMLRLRTHRSVTTQPIHLVK